MKNEERTYTQRHEMAKGSEEFDEGRNFDRNVFTQ
jgi:hypothetical protein